MGQSRLYNLHIVQNKYTEQGKSLGYKVWKACRAANPRLRVHLCLEGPCKKEIIWQPRAPVKSIVYDSPYTKVTCFLVYRLCPICYCCLYFLSLLPFISLLCYCCIPPLCYYCLSSVTAALPLLLLPPLHPFCSCFLCLSSLFLCVLVSSVIKA